MSEEFKTWYPRLTGDSEDLLEAITHIWIGLEAVKEVIPEPQATRIGFAIEGISRSMASLLRRHNININPDTQESTNE